MNIQFPKKYRSLINDVANSSGQTVESFVIKAVVQAAKNARVNHKIESEIDSFINCSKQSLWINSKQALYKSFKAVFNPYLIWFFIGCFVSLILLNIQIANLARDYNQIDILLIVIFLILFIIFLFLTLINFCLTLFFEVRYSKNKKTSMFLRLKNISKIPETDMFANRLAKKYSVEELEKAESDLKEIIVNLENRQNQFSAASILIAIAILWSIRYYSDIMFDYLINTFPGFVGNVSFVFFITALLTFISKIDYFNDLIFYKQALSGLQKAQNNIQKKD